LRQRSVPQDIDEINEVKRRGRIDREERREIMKRDEQIDHHKMGGI
jgi:hypothetical protein